MSEMFEWRHPRFRPSGTIDLEINHPDFGWIPFTASPHDAEEHGRALFEASKNVAAPYVPPPLEQQRAAIPDLTARQFRLGLLNAGLTPSQVTAAIEELPASLEKETAKVEWEYATTFHRLHPLIATVGAALGLTDDQIDAMWQAALGL